MQLIDYKKAGFLNWNVLKIPVNYIPTHRYTPTCMHDLYKLFSPCLHIHSILQAVQNTYDRKYLNNETQYATHVHKEIRN